MLYQEARTEAHRKAREANLPVAIRKMGLGGGYQTLFVSPSDADYYNCEIVFPSDLPVEKKQPDTETRNLPLTSEQAGLILRALACLKQDATAYGESPEYIESIDSLGRYMNDVLTIKQPKIIRR